MVLTRRTIRTTAFGPVLPALISALLFLAPFLSYAQQEETGQHNDAAMPAEKFQRFKLVVEPDAYYSDIDLIIALTEEPIPQLGEQTESEIYQTLLSRAAILPQFLVLEASVNPLPYFGTYLKEHNPDFYEQGRISGSLNWVKALTAGFEEPYAASRAVRRDLFHSRHERYERDRIQRIPLQLRELPHQGQ